MITRSARPRLLRSCALGLLQGLCTSAAGAQGASAGAVHIHPYVGYWLALGVVQRDVVNGRPVTRSQVGDLLAGIRGGITVGRGFAIEGGVTLSPGHVARTDSTGTGDYPGLAVAAAARLVRRTRLTADIDGVLGLGGGLLSRSREGWRGTRAAPSIALVLGMQTQLGRSSAFRAEMEAHASRGGGWGSPPWRGDVILSFGIVFWEAP